MSIRPWMPLFVPPRLSGQVLDRLLPALVAIDRDYLEEYPRVPYLYASGVRYQAEPEGEEKWLTVPWIIQAMAGDCEDLACWRAAELQLKGDRIVDPFTRSVTYTPPEPAATAVWSRIETAKGDLYHIRVQRADGRIEDPSAILGMGWEQRYVERYGPLHGITDPNEPWKPVRSFIHPAELARTLSDLKAGRIALQ